MQRRTFPAAGASAGAALAILRHTPDSRHEWEFRGRAYGTHREVNVELGPVQVIDRRTFHIHELLDRCLPKPRKVGEFQEQLLIIEENPEPML
jgi:hypothetical protein